MPKRRSPCAVVLVSLVLVLAFAIVAAAAPPKQRAAKPARPKLGLVLSGGGARGAAHLGVLEVLEQLRVPVDLVTGTSMGSVIGGLYAAGLSPEEVSQTIQSVDWVRVFQDKPDRQDLSFRRKQDDRNFLTNLRLGFKDWSIFIPSGVVEGQKLDFLLRSMTLDESGLAQIEDLPLPFRAVATDIATGEAVVFDRGPLAVAQRASMSVPAAFSPVTLEDGRELVDGYVANNLPIDVAQEIGAENVIAVDISTPVAKLKDVQSAVGIQGQVGTFPVQEQQRRQIERLKKTDVLLQPDLGDVAAASFTRMPEAVEAGRKAALEKKDELARYAVSEEEYAQWRAHQRRRQLQMPVIDAIRIENRSPVSDRVIRARIHSKTGQPLDLEQLSKDLGRLFGLDAFERVRFDLRREAEGMVLVYELEARERGRHYLRFGLNLETDIGDEAVYNLGMNHVWFPINSWDGEVRTEGQIGDTSRIGTELYQPIEPREWLFVQPFVRFERSDVDIFAHGDHIARFARDTTLTGMFVGINLGNFAQLRGGIGYQNEELSRKIGDPTVFHTEKASGGVYGAQLEYDTLDDVHFPNDGSYGLIESFWFRKNLGFDESFLRVNGGVSTYRTWRKNTIGIGLKYQTSFNAGPGPEPVQSLGGFLNLSAFDRNSLTGRHVGLARVSVYRRVVSPAVFAWEFPVYAGGMIEAGNAWDDRSDINNDILLSGGPFIGVDTPLGPLYFGYFHGEGGKDNVLLYLGRSF